MNVRVLLFARFRELAGAESLSVNLSEGSTVADLRKAIADTEPRLAESVQRCAVAVDAEFAAEATRIGVDMEIALIPPVSGG